MEVNKVIEVVSDVEVYGTSPEKAIITMLKKALASEFIAWYQYYIVKDFLVGEQRANVAELFKKNADDELDDHAEKLLNRLNELGSDISKVDVFTTLDRVSPCPYIAPEFPYNVIKLVKDNMESEECAIKMYKEIVEFTREKDPVTYTLVKDILVDEEQHLADLTDFYNDFQASCK